MSKNENDHNASPYSRFVLTPKQKIVLRHLAKGLLNKEIAAAMGLSVSTVKLHVSGILLRLNVHSRTAAVVTAQKLGLLDDE